MWQVKSLTFCLAHLFPVKPQVCNAGANCSNPNLILCKIAFVSLVTVDIVNSISRTVVNIIVLCKGTSGLVTKLKIKKKIYQIQTSPNFCTRHSNVCVIHAHRATSCVCVVETKITGCPAVFVTRN